MTLPLCGEAPPDSEPPDGYRWEHVEDRAWRLTINPNRLCRMKGCRAPSVAELKRRRRTQWNSHGTAWWAYCADHLYGRWIEDGKVVHWRMVKS